MSMQRHAEIYKAVNGKWYYEIGNFEHAGPEDSSTFGPFKNDEEAGEHMRNNHSNPGSCWADGSGKREVPTK